MEQRNLLLAIVFSVSILLGYQFLFEAPRLERERDAQEAENVRREAAGEIVADKPGVDAVTPPGATAPTPPGITVAPPRSAAGPAVPGATAAAKPAVPEPRIAIRSSRVEGSLSLRGARIDDLLLTQYRETLDDTSPQITLLLPPGRKNPYFAQFGWVPSAGDVATPSPDSVWRASGPVLSPDKPVILTWDNGAGLVFTQEIALDANYMFTVTQRVTNRGAKVADLKPYGLISRTGTPETLGFWILHEGLLGVFSDTLKEVDYDDLQDEETISQTSRGGWIGITDKYWLTALVPDQKANIASRFIFDPKSKDDKYQVDTLGDRVIIEPGKTASVTHRLFAGAKEVRLLDSYEEQLGVARFDLAVDFGWFYFLTKPIFYVLEYFNRQIGNFGLAILLLTVLIKIAFFPLANKSYRSMSRLKKLQPQMVEIRDRYKEDRARQNQEMMALYKKQNANPISGCFPILIQIPVFFSLYKVLFVSIEMRHAPFYGWIHDLSARDPLGILTAFGLIQWSVPEILEIANIGIWPLIMGGTMYLQQKLNPQPADPMQAKIFLMLPIVFTFMLGRFPAGLVIYWAWNNLLSICQQWLIMRQMGVSVSGRSTTPLRGGGATSAKKPSAKKTGAAGAAAAGADSGGSKASRAKATGNKPTPGDAKPASAKKRRSNAGRRKGPSRPRP